MCENDTIFRFFEKKKISSQNGPCTFRMQGCQHWRQPFNDVKNYFAHNSKGLTVYFFFGKHFVNLLVWTGRMLPFFADLNEGSVHKSKKLPISSFFEKQTVKGLVWTRRTLFWQPSWKVLDQLLNFSPRFENCWTKLKSNR